MSHFNIVLILLFFSLISAFFASYTSNKYADIQSQKELISLMSNSFLPESFINQGYEIDCVVGNPDIPEIESRTEKILYFMTSAPSFLCNNTLVDDIEKVKELQTKTTHRCIIEDGSKEKFLCARF